MRTAKVTKSQGIGRVGGIARAKALTKKRRKEIAEIAAKKRWNKVVKRERNYLKRAEKNAKLTKLAERSKMVNRRKPDSEIANRKLREAILSYLHNRKDRIVIVECRDNYIIIAKKVKLVTTEIANSEGFQPVERVTESVKMVMAVIAIHQELPARMPKKISNLLCRQLVEIGCPVLVIKNEWEIKEKLGE